MKPLSQLPSREPGACGGGAGSRGREGVGSSGGWELVAPSGRPPPRIPAPEPHHGARKGELLFGEGEGCPGGSASLRRGKAGGESLRKFSGRPWTGAGGGEGSGDALRGGIPRPGPDLPLFPHRQKTETAKTGSGDGGSGLPRTPGGKRGASASTTDSSTLKDPEEPIFGPIPCLPAPQAAVTWPPSPSAGTHLLKTGSEAAPRARPPGAPAPAPAPGRPAPRGAGSGPARAMSAFRPAAPPHNPNRDFEVRPRGAPPPRQRGAGGRVLPLSLAAGGPQIGGGMRPGGVHGTLPAPPNCPRPPGLPERPPSPPPMPFAGAISRVQAGDAPSPAPRGAAIRSRPSHVGGGLAGR